MVYHFAFQMIFKFEENDVHSKNISSEYHKYKKQRKEKEVSANLTPKIIVHTTCSM